jgi:uncharacterized protein
MPAAPVDLATPHLPRAAPIEAYGHGGFRFAGMSHRGSLLCLPDGIWAWPVAGTDELSEAALAGFFARAGALDIVLIGAGRNPWPLPPMLRALFHEKHISVDAMTTGAAISTYNILLAEKRRVAAGLIAVD